MITKKKFIAAVMAVAMFASCQYVIFAEDEVINGNQNNDVTVDTNTSDVETGDLQEDIESDEKTNDQINSEDSSSENEESIEINEEYPWTDWSAEKPAEKDNRIIDNPREQYRSREFAVKYTGRDKVLGYELAKNTVDSIDYTEWTTEELDEVTTKSSSKRVDKILEDTTAYQYKAYFCDCGMTCSNNPESICEEEGCGTAVNNKVEIWATNELEDDETVVSLDDLSVLGEIVSVKYCGKDTEFADLPLDEDGSICLWSGSNDPIEFYRLKIVESRNEFRKYSDWSEWDFASIEENENLEVENRTVYRYYDKVAQSLTGASSYNLNTNQSSFALDCVSSQEDAVLEFSSSNESVVAVSEDGKLSVKGLGSATITVYACETKLALPASKSIKITTELAAPGLDVTALSGRKAKVTWTKSELADGYQVWVKVPGSKSYKLKLTKGATVKSVTHSKLKKGKTYYYKVRAYKTVKGKKVYSAYSPVVSIKAK